MPSNETQGPLSRLLRPAPPSSVKSPGGLDALSAEEISTIAMHGDDSERRAAAIERLTNGEPLRQLAGVAHGPPSSPDLSLAARRRLAQLIDTQQVDWAELSSGSDNAPALLQIADLCESPACLEQYLGAIDDPQEIVRIVLEGSSLRMRQLAAQRVEDRENLNRLLKQLQGKDKSVYRILKDKRDALRAEVHHAAHIEQDIRTLCASLEALPSRTYDALFLPALEHFEARWHTFEGQAQPWARERVRTAIERCRAILTQHLKEAEEQAARIAAREAQEIARAEALAQAAAEARARQEAMAIAAAEEATSRIAALKVLEEQRAAETAVVRQIGVLMARAHGALRSGQTGPAAGLRRAIADKLAAFPTPPSVLTRGLQELDAKLASLKEWKDYAVSPKRAELIAEMEALKGSSESPPRLAERIRDLRAQWKTISQGVQVDADADWQRFNQAAAIAYEPCRIHFEAQAAARAENVARCGQLLARVQRFETAQATENPDWRLMSEVLHEAPLEWRRVGPVDRSAVRPIKAEFDAALERLRTRLTAWHAQNETRKRALIAQAQALLAEKDSRIATDGAKLLQRRWREVGPASRELENSLWQEFREHCDEVFKNRETANAEQAATLEAHKAQAITLCASAEQLAQESGTPLRDGAKNLGSWRAAMEALGELPRAEARALHQRFERALARCETRLAQQRERDAEQVYDDLLEAAQRIHGYGWSVVQGAAQEQKEALQSEAKSHIASVTQWPKGAPAMLEQAWSRAESATVAEAADQERALRMLCIRAEIAADLPTPEEDQDLRRSFQLQRLVQSMGQGAGSNTPDWKALVMEWLPVGPVAPEVYDPLLARFRRSRRK